MSIGLKNDTAKANASGAAAPTIRKPQLVRARAQARGYFDCIELI